MKAPDRYKHLFAKPITAIVLLLVFTSFVSVNESIDEERTRPSFTATIDGKGFQLREDQLFRGLVSNKSGSLDGRAPSRTVINTSFNGLTYNADEGRLFNEVIQFELGYEPEVLSELKYYSVAVQYLSGNYFMLKDESKLKVTQFEWETDKKHFLLSADYDCKLRSWGAPADGKRDIHLQGRFNKIRITVPSWLGTKN